MMSVRVLAAFALSFLFTLTAAFLQSNQLAPRVIYDGIGFLGLAIWFLAIICRVYETLNGGTK